LLCLLLLWPATAFAHILEGDAGGGFISGFEQPISGLDHIVAMVSVGLWGAQLGAPIARGLRYCVSFRGICGRSRDNIQWSQLFRLQQNRWAPARILDGPDVSKP
jgi:hypothetical protein